jgi:hypothetical protein
MRKPTCLARFSFLVLLLAAGSARATTYEVGPGATYANIGDVPIETLKAGDIVLIHARSTPYREKFGITTQGTASAPITIRGVPDANGVRPQIIGENATTRLALDYPSDARGVINISDASYLVIENLDISRARGSFKDDNGASATYSTNASTIYLQSGSHITIRNCLMHDAGNGFFSTSGTSDVLVEGNYIYGNGNVDSIYEHNNYTESDGIVFQYNRFGPLCDGCPGNNLKDRSAGLVVRYNWIEGGNRTLDLVESETFMDLPSYRTTMVYGNVLVELNDSGNPQVVHYGGDGGDESTYRKGTLHFVHNTVVTYRTGRTRLFGLSSDDEKAEVRNNIIYATAGGSQLSITDGAGTVALAGNWLSTGWTSGVDSGTLTQPLPQITGTAPGFVDFASADYHLTATSPARNAAGALEAGAPTIDKQYVPHQGSEARVADGTPDIGAFEYHGSTTSPDAAVVVPVDAGAPDAPLPSPDAARADRAMVPDTRLADVLIDRDAATVFRDAAASDRPFIIDTALVVRDALAVDGPTLIDALAVRTDAIVRDAGLSDALVQTHPSNADASAPTKDGGLSAHGDAALSPASSKGCTMVPLGQTRTLSSLWFVLGATLLVRRRRILRRLLVLLPFLFVASAAQATTYEVGTGKPYANIGNVPIESLKAGDLVLIYARSTPYREKFGITTSGTAAAPITIRGVRDANGVRPQLIGENSTTRVALNFPSDARGVINVYGANYVVIEGLDISRARGAFKDDNGSAATFQSNASAIYLQSGSHLTVRDCIMRDSGNGFFSTSATSDVLVDGSYIYGNGNVGSIYEHNNYTESNGIVFQNNRFGPLCSGCPGNNLKDRSAGTVVRYNWIEGGNRALDLVESGTWTGLASYRTTMVYGNVLIELNDSGNPQVVHYGGDGGDLSTYRKGTLHFVHNTVISYRSSRTKLFGMSSNDEKAEVRNNIIYDTAGGSLMSISDGPGAFVLSANWISSGWSTGVSGGTLTQAALQITGTNPGFVNLASWDYHLTATSPARNMAGALEAGAPTIDRQYVPHLKSEARVTEGKPDIGAFEYRLAATSTQAALLRMASGSDLEAVADPASPTPTAQEPRSPLGGCSVGSGNAPQGFGATCLVLGAWLLLRRRSRG